MARLDVSGGCALSVLLRRVNAARLTPRRFDDQITERSVRGVFDGETLSQRQPHDAARVYCAWYTLHVYRAFALEHDTQLVFVGLHVLPNPPVRAQLTMQRNRKRRAHLADQGLDEYKTAAPKQGFTPLRTDERDHAASVAHHTSLPKRSCRCCNHSGGELERSLLQSRQDYPNPDFVIPSVRGTGLVPRPTRRS